jgi:hypothetical protein
MELIDGPAAVDARSHVLLDNINTLVLANDDHHHLARVLRLRSGDFVTVTDGNGSWQQCVLPANWPAADLLDRAWR